MYCDYLCLYVSEGLWFKSIDQVPVNCENIMEIYWHISSHLFWMPSRGGLRGAGRLQARLPATWCLTHNCGAGFKIFGRGGAGDKIFALTMGRGGEWGGWTPISRPTGLRGSSGQHAWATFVLCGLWAPRGSCRQSTGSLSGREQPEAEGMPGDEPIHPHAGNEWWIVYGNLTGHRPLL